MAASNLENKVHIIAKSSLSPKSQPTTITYVSLSINSHTLHITQHRLNGKKFQEWFQFVMLVFKGKAKFGYLSGAISTPLKNTTDYQRWEAENSIIMAWLINSMKPKIG